MTPLRQFKGVPQEVVHKAEGKQFVSFCFSWNLIWCQLFSLSHFTMWSALVLILQPQPARDQQAHRHSKCWKTSTSACTQLSKTTVSTPFFSAGVISYSSHVRLQAQVQPITRSLLRIDRSIVPDFHWDKKIHGTAETFLVMVEDVDGEIVLFHDSFVLRQRYTEDKHNVTPMFEPVPPNYYISVVSGRCLHVETRLPISFKHLILLEKFLRRCKCWFT